MQDSILSQFVQSQNQTLLWKTIQPYPLIQLLDTSERAEWFKQIIQYVYEHASSSTIPHLQSLNENTIQFMMHNLEKMSTRKKEQTMVVIKSNKTQYIEPPTTTPPLKKDLSQQTATLFDLKKREFEEYATPVQPVIDFTIKEKDEPIENINELVKQHLKEREEEIQNIGNTHINTEQPPLQPPLQKIIEHRIGDNINIVPTLEMRLLTLEMKIDCILDFIKNKNNRSFDET
jgi:hypothetical protein